MKDRIDFKSPCPGKFCLGDPKKIIEWSHVGCPDSREWINSAGTIICKDCYRSFFILDAAFACEYHENDFQEANFTQVSNAISVLQMNPDINESDLFFLTILLQRIKKRAKDRGLI
jgi:hypothetical protein